MAVLSAVRQVRDSQNAALITLFTIRLGYHRSNSFNHGTFAFANVISRRNRGDENSGLQ